MSAEPIRDVNQDHKRSVKRARVLLAAKIRTGDGDVDVRLKDLSRKGALIELNGSLALGQEVTFARGETSVPARVAWTGGNRAGLEFLEMIDESEVLIHITRRTQPVNEQHFRRPRILGEDISDQERKLAIVWAKSVGILPTP